MYTLSKLKALDISNALLAQNFEISDEFCHGLIDIRYFNLEEFLYLDYIPFDCISSEWKNLYFFRIVFIPSLNTYIHPQFWQLPNINTVSIEMCDMNQSIFDSQSNIFQGYSNSLQTVSFYGNKDLCNSKLDIIGKNNSVVSDFLDRFDPCSEPCEFNSLLCTNEIYGDGVCQDACNVPRCHFDNGDCNQICLFGNNSSNSNRNNTCDIEQLLNNECNEGCNTIFCEFDKYTCASNATDDSTSVGNETCSQGCYLDWIENDIVNQEGLCDSRCNVSNCNYDNQACLTCEGACGIMYYYFKLAQATDYGSGDNEKEYLTYNETCFAYQLFLDTFELSDVNLTCDVGFEMIDLNNNGFIGFYESVNMLRGLLLIWKSVNWEQRMTQIDCSHCMQYNQSMYYF